MAKEYELEIKGQPAWHSDVARTIKMSFCEPEGGANEKTGILLLIAGYGGNSNSRVYRKMRRQFADAYNLVTLQCDYLGYQFMQNDHHLPVTDKVLKDSLTEKEFAEILNSPESKEELLRGKTLEGYLDLKESEDDYNEMGLLQAMDNLMAVKVLLDIMRENSLVPPADRMYIYGQSHGAYLAYVCNFLAPGLFSGIIENSAYLLPKYLSCDREVIKQGEILTLRKLYRYRVGVEQGIDLDSYDLCKLYDGWNNRAVIISFHGADDTMIPLDEKKEFLAHIPHTYLHAITAEDVDGEIFSSSNHSLDADLLKVFEKGYEELTEKIAETKKTVKDTAENINLAEGEAGQNNNINLMEQKFETEMWEYQMDWSENIPLLKRKEKKGSADTEDMEDDTSSSSEEKLISIIVPCYNVEKYIDRCVESLVNQTIGIEKLELIFVNDASTDSTLEHLAEWEEKYPESIIVINCEENHKQGAARNTGLFYSSASYIGYVDSDDWVDVTMYEKMYEKVEKHHPDVVCVLYTRDEQDGTIQMQSDKKENGDRYVEITDVEGRKRFFTEKLTGGVWSGIYRKELLIKEEIQFPEDLRYEDNYWGAIRDLVIGSYYIINEHLYHYMINETSTIMEKDATHHLDRLVIELMKVEEYKRRGALDDYHDEIEFSFLKLYFINTIRILFVRFSEIPYDIIYTMQDNVRELFPNYEKNPYLETLPQLQQELLKMVAAPLDKEKIDILAGAYRKVLTDNQ
ncbi:MAG: DUF2920 family protein [Lachnospiraceae bacterium]|nr:DUF2920 family protein [Lachnospiraceae bacterium]